MTSPLKEITLGREALAYIRECLEAGNALGHYLLTEIGASARITTFLPPDANLASASDFRSGGKLPCPPRSQWQYAEGSTLIPIPDTEDHLASRIESYLSEDITSLCIFENAVARAGDPYLLSLKSNVLIFGDEVYHLIYAAAFDREEIRHTIREAKGVPHFVAAMTSVAPDIKLSGVARSRVTGHDLARLAQRVEHIVVGAYDGESFLIWSRL